MHLEINMSTFKDLLSEIRMTVSADYRVTPSGRKVHKMKKIADLPGDVDGDGDVDDDDKKLAKEGVTPANMQGKQKPYVSSDGKGNFEVLGNRGQTKATFHRKEHGSNAQKQAQAHLKAKYDEYMKEDTELDEAVETTREFHLRQAAHHEKQGNAERAKHHRDQANDWRVKAAHDDSKRAQRELEQKYRKEETELDEAVDKQEQRFLLLARLGLVDKSDVSKLRIAMDLLKADKPLSIAQRSLLLSVMTDLVSIVTGDDTIFNRVKMDVQKEEVEQIDENRSVADRLAVAKQMYDQKMKSAKSPADRAQAKDDYDHIVKSLKEHQTQQIDEVLDMRHHTTGTGSIHVSHVGFGHSIGYMDAQKMHKMKPGEKHEYKDANSDAKFTAHKQADGSVKIHDRHDRHVTTIKNSMGKYDGPVKEEKDLDNACWKGFKAIGLKTKNGKKVPNCVPEETEVVEGRMKDIATNDAEDKRLGSWRKETPWTKSKDIVTDKSGAKHTAMSTAKHLARLALQKQKNKSKE